MKPKIYSTCKKEEYVIVIYAKRQNNWFRNVIKFEIYHSKLSANEYLKV